MGSANQINVVFACEGRNYFLTKGETDASVIFSPSLYIFVGIGPKEITEQTSIGNIGRPHNSLDLLERREFW